MPQFRRQAVPYPEHPEFDTFPDLNWEDLRIFLVVARHRSFRSAAEELGLALNTVRRHIDHLEHSANYIVLARNPKGVTLTRAGSELFEKALPMLDIARGAANIGRQPQHDVSGSVRISITEGLGTFWLIPKMIGFQRANPKLLLEINSTFREPNLSEMEADVSVHLKKPPHVDLKTVKLGTMHVMPYASPDYIKTFGTPKTLEDIKNHKIIEQLSPQLDVSAVDRLFPDKDRSGFVAFSTNTSTTHFWCVVRGGGLGMLPTYLSPLRARIVPIDIPELQIAHEIWLSYHPDSKRARAVVRVIDAIRRSFKADLFPWFRDQFVHPKELLQMESKISDDLSFAGLVDI